MARLSFVHLLLLLVEESGKEGLVPVEDRARLENTAFRILCHGGHDRPQLKHGADAIKHPPLRWQAGEFNLKETNPGCARNFKMYIQYGVPVYHELCTALGCIRGAF